MPTVFEKTVEKTLQASNELSNFAAQDNIAWFSGLQKPRPDFQFKTTEKIVADAKWKLLEAAQLTKHDQYQIFSYMQTTNANRGLIFYPAISGEHSIRPYHSEIPGCSATISLVPFRIDKPSEEFSPSNINDSNFELLP